MACCHLVPRSLRTASAWLACCVLWTGLPSAAVEPVQATWTAQPLREVAERLSLLAGQPVIIDRRIDPTTPITLTAAGEPFDDVIERVAASAGATAARLDSGFRIAPAEAATKAVAAEQARRHRLGQLPAPQRRLLETRQPWAWSAGSRPRDLLADIAAAHGLVIDGLDLVPHDHFPAATLPPLSLATRIDLVLAHFDLGVQWSPGTAGGTPAGRIAPLPEPVAAMPPPRRPPRKIDRPAGRQVYTLRLEAPLDAALTAITRQIGLGLQIDEASLTARGVSPREIVRADVRSASRDELLDAVLGPVGLSWTIDDGTLRVRAGEPEQAERDDE
jgi:hypothetical protein